MSDDKGMDLYEAYAAAPEEFAQLAEVMYGDGAWELVAKLSADERRKNKRQAQVGLATNVLGISAGTAALGSALHDYNKVEPKADAAPRRIPKAFKPVVAGGKKFGKLVRQHPKKAAGAALGLQAANLGGDFVANRVLAREAKKKAPISKGLPSALRGKRSAGITANTARITAHKMGQAASRELARGNYDRASQAAYKGGYNRTKGKILMKDVSKSWSLKPVQESITWRGEISKRDDDKRQVFGWASVVERNGQPVVDHQDDMIPVEVIEKAAYDYVKSSRKGGDMHRRNGDQPHHVSDMVESFLVTPEKKRALGLPDDFPTGWWVGFQVNDEDTWQKVKNGERTEFSIHGSGQRIEKVLED